MYLLTIVLPASIFLICVILGRYIGHKGVYLISKNIMLLLIIITMIILREIIMDNNIITIEIGNWIVINDLKLNWLYILDDISVIMLLIVYSITTIVFIYSYDYLIEDAHKIRFFGYINLFVFCMIILITTTSLPILFIGWEGVGLSSFLLISFWYNRIETSLGGLLAFIMNRIGDIFFILGMLMSYWIIGSIDIITMISYPNFNADIILIFFIIAAMAKSAQIFLHIWLIYSMEGPTPISALIHAATMVTAGVILLIRLSLLVMYSYYSLMLILFIGSMTAFIGGILAITATDLKELIAYSTMSQLGYMVTILGLQSSSLSFYHLINHAYFKALLFLTAGSIIHTVKDIQDIRKLGSLVSFIPISYISILIGFFSLTGLPFTTGFYSKESIINYSAFSYQYLAEFAYWITLLSALFTLYYSYSFILNVFYKSTRLSLFILKNLHYYSFHLTSSLLSLSIITILFGYLTFKFIYILNVPINFYNLQLSFLIKIIPVTFFFLISIFYLYYKSDKNISNKIFQNSFFFYNLYTQFGAIILNLSYRILFKIFDYGFIDLLAGSSFSSHLILIPRYFSFIHSLSYLLPLSLFSIFLLLNIL